MKLHRLLAFVYRDFKIFARTQWKLVDFLYFPLTTVLIWGLFSVYVKDFSGEIGMMVMMVNVFWSFAYISQANVNLFLSEDSWSGSLKQLLATGVSDFEYMLARIISSSIISIPIMSVLLLTVWGFGFPLVRYLWDILILTGITLFISMSLAVLIAGLIIFLGRSYEFLSWSALQAFILFSAPFFPIEILPFPLDSIALVMPYTWIFRAVRLLVFSGWIPREVFFKSIVIGILYLGISIPFYKFAFHRARKTGELARMD